MNKLDNAEFVKKVDRSNMLKFISGLPEQCRDAYRIGSSCGVKPPPVKINNIIFAGMGGSGIGADLIKVYLQDELKVPVSICRNYILPDFTGKGTLLFCSSYSGNTEESLSCFEQGLKRNAFIIAMGAGGRLKELSSKNSVTYIQIPPGYPPRAAIGYLSVTVLGVLFKTGLIGDKEKDVNELFSVLSDISNKEIGFSVPLEKNIAKQIAVKMYKKFPVVYGTSDITEAVSSRWRGQIAENGKTLSSSNALPEMNHNEIVGWRFPLRLLKNFMTVILRDKDDHEKTKTRIRISSEIIKKSGADAVILERENGGRLARVFSLIYIGDFASFYLAILNNVDPTPVDAIDYLKKELVNKEK